MSVRIMSLVFDYEMPDLKTDDGRTASDSACKFVLLALADAANDEGEGAYLGVRKLCKMTCLSTQTVCNALNALRHNKFTTLLEEKSKYDTNNYTINVKRLGFYSLERTDSNEQNGPSTNSIFQIYESNIGPLTPMIADALEDAEKIYPHDWIVESIALAVENNKRNWRYCEAILKRWQESGKDSGRGNGQKTEKESEYTTL